MAGVPEGHKPDEAGDIRQAPEQAPQAHVPKPEEPVATPAEPAPGESAPKPGEPAPAPAGEQAEPVPQAPGFGERGRMRRRARFLRRARELAYRDLGGLVFDLHRFGQRNDQVVLAKLATLGHIDAELRALEEALREVRPVTVLREVGIAACPRCAAIHGSDDHFCPGCGLAFDRSADRPLSTAPVTPTAPSPQPTAAPTAAAPVAAATAATTSPPSATAPAAAAPSTLAADLSVGPPTTPAEPAPPVKPTATPVAARPSFPVLSRPTPSQVPGPASPPATPPSPDLPQPVSPDNGEQKREPEDEPTQILRPPARGA